MIFILYSGVVVACGDVLALGEMKLILANLFQRQLRRTTTKVTCQAANGSAVLVDGLASIPSLLHLIDHALDRTHQSLALERNTSKTKDEQPKPALQMPG